ncbi:MAG: methyltransferase domain-containing protein [Rhodanobacteraceae bacterium]
MKVFPASLFASAPALALFREEMGLAREYAMRQPNGRALLLAPTRSAAPDWTVAHLQPVHLHVAGNGLDGDVRCAAASLAWENAAFQMIVVQHVCDVLPDVAALISELERVLAPGGALIWFGFNPRSPWFAWCQWHAWRDRTAAAERLSRRHSVAMPTMHRHLFGQRLQSDELRYVGSCWPRASQAASLPAPRWRALDALRAAYVLVVRNRPQVLTPLRARAARPAAASRPHLVSTPSQRASA